MSNDKMSETELIKFCYTANLGHPSTFDLAMTISRLKAEFQRFKSLNLGTQGYIWPFLNADAFVTAHDGDWKEKPLPPNPRRLLRTNKDLCIRRSTHGLDLFRIVDYAIGELEKDIEGKTGENEATTISTLLGGESSKTGGAWSDDSSGNYGHFPWPYLDSPSTNHPPNWRLSRVLSSPPDSNDDYYKKHWNPLNLPLLTSTPKTPSPEHGQPIPVHTTIRDSKIETRKKSKVRSNS